MAQYVKSLYRACNKPLHAPEWGRLPHFINQNIAEWRQRLQAVISNDETRNE